MNLNQEKALFHLTGKLSLSQIAPETLQQVLDEAPYFAPARFFQTAKIQGHSKSEVWENSLRHTQLYFTNPLWLSLQLSGTEKDTVRIPGSHTGTGAEATGVTAVFRKNFLTTDPLRAKPDEHAGEVFTDPGSGITTENKIAGILSGQLADFRKPIDPNAELEIDADRKRMHTIDYFASQGIKIDLSAIPQDKLTTHLRKFTDWLKQLKAIQGGSVTELTSNPEMEKAVAENAKISNETGEVVTEAMAEVLMQQGQTGKAIQLYIKLSFLNPEKSSYFAAKIEQLKGI